MKNSLAVTIPKEFSLTDVSDCRHLWTYFPSIASMEWARIVLGLDCKILFGLLFVQWAVIRVHVRMENVCHQLMTQMVILATVILASQQDYVIDLYMVCKILHQCLSLTGLIHYWYLKRKRKLYFLAFNKNTEYNNFWRNHQIMVFVL